MTMGQPSFSFSQPWRELSQEQADAVLREIRRELSPGHPLHGANLTPIAKSGLTDDVLLQLDDGRVADVHLTWTGCAEGSPWPRHRVFASLEEWVQQVMVRGA